MDERDPKGDRQDAGAIESTGRKDSIDQRPDDPPVVARLVVEIRSDGTRTIARGALEDVSQGQRVALEARGTSPQQLMLSLARSLVETPLATALRGPGLVRSAIKALLPGGRNRTS